MWLVLTSVVMAHVGRPVVALDERSQQILRAARESTAEVAPWPTGADAESPLLGRLLWSAAGFWIMEHEVTQAQWTAVMGENAALRQDGACDRGGVPKDEAQLPVVCVSFDEAEEFVRRASMRDGVTYALPTEAQWRAAVAALPDLPPPVVREPSAAARAWLQGRAAERDEMASFSVEPGVMALWAPYFADATIDEGLDAWPSDQPALAELCWMVGRLLLDVAAAEREAVRSLRGTAEHDAYIRSTVAPLEIRGRRYVTTAIRSGRIGGFTSRAVQEAEAYVAARGWRVPPNGAVTSYDAEDGPAEVCSRAYVEGAACDLLGNVWEWTRSGGTSGAVALGGSWADGPASVTAESRVTHPFDTVSDRIGLRLVRVVGP